MQITVLDLVLGAALTFGLLYLFYRIDQKYVYKKEKLGLWAHVLRTNFFPKRAVAYLITFGVILAFLSGAQPGMMQDSLSYILIDFALRIAIYPFLVLILACAIAILKILFFPAPDDPDRGSFRRAFKRNSVDD